MITIKATASKKINVWPLFQRAAAGGINETGAEIVTLAAKGSPFEYGVLRGSWALYQPSKIQGKSITPARLGSRDVAYALVQERGGKVKVRRHKRTSRKGNSHYVRAHTKDYGEGHWMFRNALGVAIPKLPSNISRRFNKSFKAAA